MTEPLGTTPALAVSAAFTFIPTADALYHSELPETAISDLALPEVE